ncbi:DnaD domain protein [Ligilactobacillus murinus]|uniref:DnaD domain protein n=1 Tax=Ligilactobacillus murinus TaxID=1622 RepID=A0A4S2EHN6_9LACO|nr:DnaD domain protein [Ligilactobacillus murinus]TGY55468.1 DnaD domain protein [Ligilactobacillus murinus]
MELPSYYSILTADVRYDRRLGKPNARELYSEITALSNKDGYCHASNGYFARLYEVEERTISRWISLLEECGYLQREIIYEKDSKQVKERRLYPISSPLVRNVNTPRQKKQEGIDSGVGSPPDRNVQENNTSINTTSKNINNNTKQQADASNAFTAFQMSGATLNGFTMPQLVEYVDKLGDELVRHAIEYMSNSAPKASFNYLKRILDSYENTGITTVEQAIKLEKAFREKREQRRQSNSYKPKQTNDRDLSDKHYGTDADLEAEFFGEA